MEHTYFTYILASRRNGTLYIGVTNDLVRRVFELKEGLGSAFTRKYGVKCSSTTKERRNRRRHRFGEKAMKQWLRKWKLELIERENPTWRDLSEDFLK